MRSALMLDRVSMPRFRRASCPLQGEYVDVVDDAVDHRGGHGQVDEPADRRRANGVDAVVERDA